jgi:AcrR family transcriptional regulator
MSRKGVRPLEGSLRVGAGAEEAPARGRGRPRSTTADQAILAATLRMLAAHGVSGVTMEGVAAEAGVGKTTVYRRWESKTELIIAAVSVMAPAGEPPDTGTFWGDLQALADLQLERLAGTGLLTVAPRVLAEGMNDPELHQAYLDNVIDPIRGVIRTLVERGIARGELRKDLEVEPLVDLLHALPIYKIMISRGDPGSIRPVRDAFMPLLTPGLSSSSEGRASARRRSSGSSRARRARSG